MARFCEEVSRTFAEYLLMPGLTKTHHTPQSVSLRTALVKHNVRDEPSLRINIPFVSSIMQAVSGVRLATQLSRCGGLSFIYHSQPIAEQAEMIRQVKNHKAGFVVSDSNLVPQASLAEAIALCKATGHSTIAVTADGSSSGPLLGLLTSRDFSPGYHDLNSHVSQHMVPVRHLVLAKDVQSLRQANEIIVRHRLDVLPIVDDKDNLRFLVFRKDYESHRSNPEELVDNQKRLLVGAGINTHDYKERVPALLSAGADVLCVDASDGYTEWQRETITYIKREFGQQVLVGGGNVVDGDGFRYLVDSGADFVKIGIGGGSICITREQKGIGRGQASALIDVARTRDALLKDTGIYVPICSDGGILQDYHMILALAMGADFLMLGRYFARFDEGNSSRIQKGDKYYKEYWGEGSQRAKNWQRYDLGGPEALTIEEGVDGYVPYAGHLQDNLNLTLHKIRLTMCNCGVCDLAELRREARLVLVSQQSFLESTYSIQLRNTESQ